jgi:poly-beta-1,6-N-acetyl-D-glucosamine synthase
VARLLVISPVRNEAKHIERVARAMAAQTRPPDAWVVVDDHSTDGTREILDGLEAEHPFMHVRSSASFEQLVRDRLAVAAEACAFNGALNSMPWRTYTHISKLDGDIELPPRYYELLLEEFELDPRLGLAGGVLLERTTSGWEIDAAPEDYHVRGALKCYTLDCFEAVGGIRETLGWDTIDEVYARMRGFRTRSIGHLVGKHHRPLASADGVIRGKVRYGRTFYLLHFPLPWVLVRAMRTCAERPRGLSGMAFLGGYLHAWATRTARVDDPEYRRWVRRELGGRARAALRLPPRRLRASQSAA